MAARRSDDPEVMHNMNNRHYSEVLRWAEEVLCDLPATAKMEDVVASLKTFGGQEAYSSLTTGQKTTISEKLLE